MDYTRLIDEFLDAVARNENPKQHYNYIKVFSIIKNYVIEKNKSLEEMNLKELDELFFTRFTGRADSIKRIVTYCRRYIRWLQTTGHLSFRDAESHILFDLRYYNLSIPKYLKENGISDVLFIYNTDNFLTDNNLNKISAYLQDK